MKITRFLLAVGFVLALAFAFVGCSGSDDGSSDRYSSSSAMDVSSSSSVEAESSSSSVEVSSSSSVILSSSSYVCNQEGIFDGSPIIHEGETYETVVICNQTWLKHNLNYAPPDGNSWCYSGYDYSTGVSITAEEGCAKYGRLYDWTTAMDLSSSCNSSSCSGQVQAKHKGICPSGWHIPTYDDWSTLGNNVGGSSTAGRYLKSKEGWNSCGPAGSGKSYLCEDTYGFSALPGGYRSTGGSFSGAGNHGYWWSASEINSFYAYSRYMYSNVNNATLENDGKDNGYSVRCVQD
jgi:uncharacterized protein (TIGR02145 family)